MDRALVIERKRAWESRHEQSLRSFEGQSLGVTRGKELAVTT